MFESDTIAADETAAIPEDEDVTLRQNAPAVHEHPKDTYFKSWVYFGKYAMPGSEHLIPFRT